MEYTETEERVASKKRKLFKIISVRQPWAWLIINYGKDIENRDWPTNYRGAVLIHASRWFGKGEVYDDFQFAKRLAPPPHGSVTLNDLRAQCGHIIGRVNLIDCVEKSESPWFFGRYGFVLKGAEPITPIPFKARLGLFDCPDDVRCLIDAASPPQKDDE